MPGRVREAGLMIGNRVRPRAEAPIPGITPSGDGMPAAGAGVPEKRGGRPRAVPVSR